jgi:hypothetical protein
MKTNLEILDSWGEYIEVVKEEMNHRHITIMDSIEICDRCGDFLLMKLTDDGNDVKYVCPRDRFTIGWEAIALRGLK